MIFIKRNIFKIINWYLKRKKMKKRVMWHSEYEKLIYLKYFKKKKTGDVDLVEDSFVNFKNMKNADK